MFFEAYRQLITSVKSLNWVLTILSILICALMLLIRHIPGMEIFGVTPNWFLIWVVSWSIISPVTLPRGMKDALLETTFAYLQGGAGGLILGLIQDGMTGPYPSHAPSLTLVGILTVFLHKQAIRHLREDFISIALVVFGMTLVSETVMALQFSSLGHRTLGEIWTAHQQIALSSAILSSLWAPVLYFPLNRLWRKKYSRSF